MAKFEELRISLAEKDILPFEEKLSRREFLEKAFEKKRVFFNKNKETEFIPLQKNDDYILGIFKRLSPVSLKDSDLMRYDAENYEFSLIILSIKKEQLVWVQNNPKVGTTQGLLKFYFESLSKENSFQDWKVYVEYLHDEREYFSVIKEYREVISEITFTFIPPNALDAESEIYELLREVTSEAHPDTIKHVYEADPGKMYPDTKHMNASANIAIEGGGDAKVKGKVKGEKGKILYSSEQARVQKSVPDEQISRGLSNIDDSSFLEDLCRWLFQ